MTKTTTEPTYKERIEKAAGHISDAVAILHDVQTDWEEAMERRDAAGQEPPDEDPMDESIGTLADWAIEAESLEGDIEPELADTFTSTPVTFTRAPAAIPIPADPVEAYLVRRRAQD